MTDFHWRLWEKRMRREALEREIVEAAKAVREVVSTAAMLAVVYLAICALAA